jgi:DNA polymerase III subunit alpha
MSFVNLHCHSHYSLLDGFGSPKEIILRAKELGYPAASLTDHGVTYGLIEFYEECLKAEIAPVLGCELYVARRTRLDKEARVDVKPYHLTILAENNEGYENLLELVTKANLEGFYYKPRVDYELLKLHSKGLIALSGCLQGHIPRAILDEDEVELKKIVERYLDIFGKDNFFLEVQDNPLSEEQQMINEKIKELSKEYEIGLVLTYDSHYPRSSDREVHDLLLCIQTQTTVDDENRMRYAGDYSIRDVAELKDAFKDYPNAIENTVKIAKRCKYKFNFEENLIPSFKTPNKEKPYDYLKESAKEGLKERFPGKKVPKEYSERLDYELNTVHKMGFDTYFLIVADFIRYAKEQKITVGPGRGSAAGSMLSWSLKITELDPIEYGLFFERFLNPERVSMPDIDIDFADTRRDEVLDYVVEKYGREKVAQIVTFGTMMSRAAIRDVGRALGYPYAEVDQLAKTVPPPALGKHVPLRELIKEDPDLKEVYEKNKRVKTLLDFAKKIEGTVRHVGTHACAVVISEDPLVKYTALQHGASGDEIVTQFSAKPLEKLGLLKMDFLGLRNLTVIEKTEKIVKRTRKQDVDCGKISLEDKKTFELFQKGDTTGVFQFESPGMKKYLKQLKPTIFDDIIAMGALYRPGPMDWIPNYIKGKHNPEKVSYLDDSFKSILANTYGVAVYQEQILQIARDFAGFSLGEADILRKAVGKKITSLLREQRDKFVKGAVKNGHKEKFAEEVFEKVIEPFAGYGFNKAHAACYGMIAYQTAYLKAHFPVEFMTSLLCSDANNTDRVVLEIKEAIEMGINVLPPSVNESFCHFTVVDQKTIRFGLLAIKGVGEGPIREMIEIRDKGGDFKSLEDFATRLPSKLINKKMIQALALSGAFDDFGDRNQIAENYEELAKFSKYSQDSLANGQTDIFGVMEDAGEKVESHFQLKKVPELSVMDQLKMEKKFLGMYVSGHPLRGLSKYIKKKASLIGEMNKKHVNKNVAVLGLITNLKKILTRSGLYMATFVLEDSSAKVNAILFPKKYNNFVDLLVEDNLVVASGKLDKSRGSCQIFVDNMKVLSINNVIKSAKDCGAFDKKDKAGIFIRSLDDILEEQELAEKPNKDEAYLIKVPNSSNAEIMESLKNILMRNKGKTPVEIHLLGTNKKIKLPFNIKLSDELDNRIKSLLLQ